jgi:hypothetical protein
MKKKKATSRKPRAPEGGKQTRADLAKAAKKHFPRIKLAAEKALRDAGLHGVQVHAMMFNVDERSLLDQCDPPCGPNEKCRLSSNGTWMCVPS